VPVRGGSDNASKSRKLGTRANTLWKRLLPFLLGLTFSLYLASSLDSTQLETNQCNSCSVIQVALGRQKEQIAPVGAVATNQYDSGHYLELQS
jgi:hypothetical protein